MKIAFDLHGTLDTNQGIIILLMKMFEGSGHDVCIISGSPCEEIKAELMRINHVYFSCIKNIFSVVDFVKSEKVPMKQHQDGSWYCDDFYWWRTKGLICMKEGIHMIFDNDLRYKKHMPESTTFIHWNRQTLV